MPGRSVYADEEPDEPRERDDPWDDDEDLDHDDADDATDDRPFDDRLLPGQTWQMALAIAALVVGVLLLVGSALTWNDDHGLGVALGAIGITLIWATFALGWAYARGALWPQALWAAASYLVVGVVGLIVTGGAESLVIWPWEVSAWAFG